MKPATEDAGISLVPTSGSDRFIGFAVHAFGERIGTVAFKREAKTRASIRWNLQESHAGQLGPVLKLAVDRAFDDLGITRVEAQITTSDHKGARAAAIAGLRKEGILRGHGADADQIMVARLADDPDPWSRNGFLGILNAGLPTKRVIAQGILRDENRRVLLCELTYKPEWDLPGGVVEVGESPAQGVVREIAEELGITIEVNELLTVNWLPAWRGWDDACVFVFDLGVAETTLVDQMTLEKREIVQMHWCDDGLIAAHATTVTQELLAWLDSETSHAPYRESRQERS